MSLYVLSTDSNSDLPVSYIEEHGLLCLPLFYQLDDIVYGKEQNLEPHEFYDIMRGGKMPTTMAVNPADVREIWEPALKEGKDILHLSFSSGLSGSCQCANLVATDLMEEYPERKIIVIDTLAASMGEGLVVNKAVELKEEGKTMEEISEYMQENLKHFVHLFTVNDLFHLYRGGRVSKTSAVIGTLVNIKPILHVSDEGKLIPINKIRGRKKSLLALVDMMEPLVEGFIEENKTVFISHGDCIEDAQFVADEIKKRFGIDNFLINFISPSIGSHSGPGTVALFFYGKDRK